MVLEEKTNQYRPASKAHRFWGIETKQRQQHFLDVHFSSLKILSAFVYVYSLLFLLQSVVKILLIKVEVDDLLISFQSSLLML